LRYRLLVHRGDPGTSGAYLRTRRRESHQERITQVFGTTLKALIEEEFGDGIMSAIDFELSVDRIPDAKGDRVKVTFNGKFLPYRRY
jgi:hypothetical protein